MKNNYALISFKTTVSQSLEAFGLALDSLKGAIHWRQISAIYRVHRPAESFSNLRDIRSEEYLDGLSCVVLGESLLTSLELKKRVTQTDESLRQEKLRRAISSNLLVVGTEIHQTPELTLPHPEFHLKPEEIVAACEIWPDYIHPILQISLRELALQFIDQSWGEYHCAGSPLLDRKNISHLPEEQLK